MTIGQSRSVCARCIQATSAPALLIVRGRIVIAVQACGIPAEIVSPAPRPTPSVVEPRAGTVHLYVAWQNRSHERLILTVAEDGELAAFAEVLPCTAHDLAMDVRPPFAIGLGPQDGPINEPLPAVLDSTQLPPGQPPDFLVRIDPEGRISTAPRSGPPVVGRIPGCTSRHR